MRNKAMDKLAQTATTARRESKYIDFKERFDVSSNADWCEIIKDIVAMANSGGGLVLVGVKDDGTPALHDLSAVRSLDSATVTDKINKYTGEQFADFEIIDVNRDGQQVIGIRIQGSRLPLVFSAPGNYEAEGGRQKCAFARGTIYCRHGAKSEPATGADIRRILEQEVERIRRGWMSSIRRIVQAPPDAVVTVAARHVVESQSPDAQPVRLVDDPSAPAYYKVDPNRTHPFRQKDVIAQVNERIGQRRWVNTFDIHCVRRVHRIDAIDRFSYKPAFGSRQYSSAFVEWLLEQFRTDGTFFDAAREQYGATTSAHEAAVAVQ